jgi:hypothetical protein
VICVTEVMTTATLDFVLKERTLDRLFQNSLLIISHFKMALLNTSEYLNQVTQHILSKIRLHVSAKND